MRIIPAQGRNGFNFKTPYPASFGSLAGQPHLGIDILCPIGTPVVAPEDGVVGALPATTTARPLQGGNQVYLKGDSGIFHRLMHNSKFMVKVGERVRAGQQVAVSGNSGSATNAPHVHWDCDTKGFNTNISSKIDPNKWLQEGEDMDFNFILEQTIRAVAGRPADAGDKSFWLPKLESGEVTLEKLIKSFLNEEAKFETDTRVITIKKK